MKDKNILISGASIARPALAFWLNRYGFNTTVIERAPGIRRILLSIFVVIKRGVRNFHWLF